MANICYSFGYLCLQVGRGYSRTFKASFIQALCVRYILQKEKNEADKFYNALNSDHENLKLILELDTTKSTIQRLFEVTVNLQLMCTIK